MLVVDWRATSTTAGVRSLKTLIRLLLTITVSLHLAWAAEDTDTPVVWLDRAAIGAGSATLPERGFISTGQPDAAVLQAIAEAGFVAVVDLRTVTEDRGIDEQAEVEGLGMSYINLPVAGSAGITFENAARLDRILAGLDGPVLLHCGSGNRVGALFALREKRRGADAEQALAVGKAAGLTRSEEIVRERLAGQ